MSQIVQFRLDDEECRRLEGLAKTKGKKPNALAREILLKTLSVETANETTLKSLEEMSEVLEGLIGGEVLSLLQRTFNFCVRANVAMDEHIKRLNLQDREEYLHYRKTVDSRTEETLNRLNPKPQHSSDKAEDSRHTKETSGLKNPAA